MPGYDVSLDATGLDQLDDAAGVFLDDILNRIADDARLIVPIDTGALRASIRTTRDGLTGTVGSDLDYASYVEEGTSRMAAQPFLSPALYRNR